MNTPMIDVNAINIAKTEINTWIEDLKQTPQAQFNLESDLYQSQSDRFKVHFNYVLFNVWSLKYGKSLKLDMQRYIKTNEYNHLPDDFKVNLQRSIDYLNSIKDTFVYAEDDYEDDKYQLIFHNYPITNQWIIDELSHIQQYLSVLSVAISDGKAWDEYLDDYGIMVNNLYTKKLSERLSFLIL